jgi:response regulator RpfG family c-di-GMP phosphodiesterase
MALRHKHTLLLVDDEESVTNSLQRTFRKEKYDIRVAASGAEGLNMLKEAQEPLSLIISDQRMPGMTGAQFLEKAKRIFPYAMRILLTAYSDMDAIVDAVNKGEIHRYLTKPWNDDDLLVQVRQALEQYDLLAENRRLLALTKRQNKKLRELNRNLEEKVVERSREIVQKNKELSRLNQELESSLYNTVRAFASLVEIYASSSLAGHGRRGGAFSRRLAELFDLSQHEVTQIEIAGLLHDIGKLGLPQRLLEYKEDTWWRPQDKELFRKHPKQGQATVQFIDKLNYVGLMIRSHHERYDGQGYPDQLAQKRIPLGARIIAVADAYDKIVHLKVGKSNLLRRVAKEANITHDRLSEADILQKAAVLHLKQQASTIYDPDIVEVFLNLLKEKDAGCKQEKTVSIQHLEENMILSRPLYSSSGRFLMPYNTVLTRNHISKLRKFHEVDFVTDVIHVLAN